MKKVILISIDGMRPDGFLQCGNPFTAEMMKLGSYTLDGRTVDPSITLPCHMSMFHSVPPQRHGILNNTYTPMVRPVTSLFEQLSRAGAVNAMFYGWHPLRDIATPGSLQYAQFRYARTADNTDDLLTLSALSCIETEKPDFVFLYMVETDEKGGHDCGWMTEAYLDRVSRAIENVRRVWQAVKDEYTIIVTADHGGHDRTHGTLMPEDMTIPMFFIGEDFTPGEELHGISILDIAPTAVKVMGVQPPRDWEGKPVF